MTLPDDSRAQRASARISTPRWSSRPPPAPARRPRWSRASWPWCAAGAPRSQRPRRRHLHREGRGRDEAAPAHRDRARAAPTRPTTTAEPRAPRPRARRARGGAHRDHPLALRRSAARATGRGAASIPLFEVAAEDAQSALFDQAFERWFQRVARRARPRACAGSCAARLRERPARAPARRGPAKLVEQRDFDGALAPRSVRSRRPCIDAAVGAAWASLARSAADAIEPDDWLAKCIATLAPLERRSSIAASGCAAATTTASRPSSRDLARWIRAGAWTTGPAARQPFGGDPAAPTSSPQRDAVKADARPGSSALLRRRSRRLPARRAARRWSPSTRQLKSAPASSTSSICCCARATSPRRAATCARSCSGASRTSSSTSSRTPIRCRPRSCCCSPPTIPPSATGPRAAPAPGKLFVVGDPKQSIYRFRRADVALYEAIKQRLCAAGAEVLYLSTSFRSVPAIQQAVNARLRAAHAGGPARTRPTTSRSRRARADRRPARADRAAGPRALQNDWGDLAASATSSGRSRTPSARSSTGWSKERLDSRPSARASLVPVEARHVCLLFQRFQSFGDDITRPYVRALEARRIPHVLVGGRSLPRARRGRRHPQRAHRDRVARRRALGLRHVARAVLLPVRRRAAASGASTVRHRCIRSSPARVGDRQRDRRGARRCWRACTAGATARPIADTIAQLLEATRAHAGIAIWPTGEQALANVLRVVDLARRFEAGGASSFRAFVERLRDEAERERGGRGAGASRRAPRACAS